jgi:hypothetical protein
MSLPVAPSAYIYSHFRHVSGVPAPEGVRGATISRLKILDTLIEQLARLKERPGPLRKEEGGTSEERINALIEQYENQIRSAFPAGAKASSALAQGAALPYSPAAAAAPSGAVFSLTV